jgi:GAF domain-containing protein
MPHLEAWLDGTMEPPVRVFLQVVDILSTPASQAVPETLALLSPTTRALHAALDTALAATGAERGNIQLARPDGLYIEVQAGFERPFLDFFFCVADDGCACGAAARRGERIVVTDVERDPIFAGTAARGVLLDAGARAVQSTPLLARSGALLGMLSTHYERRYRPSDDELRIIDRIAADTVACLEGQPARA